MNLNTDELCLLIPLIKEKINQMSYGFMETVKKWHNTDEERLKEMDLFIQERNRYYNLLNKLETNYDDDM